MLWKRMIYQSVTTLRIEEGERGGMKRERDK